MPDDIWFLTVDARLSFCGFQVRDVGVLRLDLSERIKEGNAL
jgi:hypothetical protein